MNYSDVLERVVYITQMRLPVYHNNVTLQFSRSLVPG